MPRLFFLKDLLKNFSEFVLYHVSAELLVGNDCLIRIRIYQKDLRDTFHMLNSSLSGKVLMGVHSIISASTLCFEFIIK